MKTHLPHKLRAALMAALASVSLTSYAAAADLTWTEPGYTYSMDSAKWSYGSVTGLKFTAGDNAIFAGTDVVFQTGTIHAVNVDVKGNTTVKADGTATGAIYSSGTVTIGDDCTLTLDGGELHILNTIKGGENSTFSCGSFPSDIYWQGDYDVNFCLDNREVATFKEVKEVDEYTGETYTYLDFVAVKGDHYQDYATKIWKTANIFDAHCGIDEEQLQGYIDGRVLNVYVGGDKGTSAVTETVGGGGYDGYGNPIRIPTAVGVQVETDCKTFFLNCDEDRHASIAEICSGEHSDTNTVAFFGGWQGQAWAAGKATLELSSDKPVTIVASSASFSTTNSGKLTDVILGAGNSWTLANGTQVTFPDLVITAKEDSMLQSGADFGQSDYNSSEVTMKNLKVEVTGDRKEVMLRNKLENVDIENAKARTKLNVLQGQGVTSLKSAAKGAEVNLLNIKDGADLTLKELYIGNESKIGVYKNGTAGASTNGDNVGKLTMAEGSTIFVDGYGGTLEANLALKSDTFLDFSSGGIISMSGNDVYAAQGSRIKLDTYREGYLLGMGDPVTLFSNVRNTFSVEVSVDGWDGWPPIYFQTVDGNAVLSLERIELPVTPDPTPAAPEPTTGTLSLLALAGLCARRRRKH